MIKTSKSKITQSKILKYNLCEHHKVGYQQLEKLCKKQEKIIDRLSKDCWTKMQMLTEWRENNKNWVSKVNQELLIKNENHNKEMEETKAFYEKELTEISDLYDSACKHNREIVKTNEQILKQHNEITRAYNGLHHMGKFAEELGIDISKHNKMLPENDEYNQFTQKHQLLESGKVQHTWTLKKKKKGDTDDKK